MVSINVSVSVYKYKIENQRTLKLKCRTEKSGKFVNFGQGKPGKVREFHNPQVLRTMTYTKKIEDYAH